MFKTYFHHELEPKISEMVPESWDGFTRRYFYGDQDHQLQNHTPFVIRNESTRDEESTSSSTKGRCNKSWIWVGITIVYLAAIGIVVAVLLLAPKYPSAYSSDSTAPSSISNDRDNRFVLVAIDQGIPDSEGPQSQPLPYYNSPHSEHAYHHDSLQIKHIIPSPRDEVILYDINPRRLKHFEGNR